MHQTIEVVPTLPEPLTRLSELARNLWFAWNGDARSLFYRLDRALWRDVHHNPIVFLQRVSQQRLLDASQDRTYLAHYKRTIAAYDVYASDVHTWYSSAVPEGSTGQIAYFSAEFGIHESLPIFSGGLGVLAGDHCKSASDLGLPFVGMGLLYRKGYFQQQIDAEGRQQDIYVDHSFAEMPIAPVLDAKGHPLSVEVTLAGRRVTIKVWVAKVGRIPLYLLDTDVPENGAEDRLITQQLYGGDMEVRICQEIVLGMGGVRALDAMGIDPSVWHMNEGHSVFLGLERIRHMVERDGLTFREAQELVRATTVFTTHTPVPAGHDAFPLHLKEKYFRPYWEAVGLEQHEFLALGLEVMPEGHELFSLTVLALNLAGWCNGVSRLHGDVSSQMWEPIWPHVPVDENPISYITNGVHTLSWLAPEMVDLFDQHLGEEWRSNITQPGFWDAVDSIPDGPLWSARQDLKRRMINRVRERLVRQRLRNGEGPAALIAAERVLDPECLTIGFARRFATYKRATLLFRDVERLARLVTDSERPIQFVFAGKAHPADKPGQELIRQIHEYGRSGPFAGRVVLVEDYDISIARYLVSGVDVWLNTPRRPFEASGTSGMKVSMNGGANLSVLDGWWCEAAEDGVNGWSIGDERDVEDEERHAEQDAESLYQLLEQEIIPRYYERNAQGIPERWVAVAKGSIRTVLPQFNTDRMVAEYAQRLYFPALAKGHRLREDNFRRARDLADWKHTIRERWDGVRVDWGSRGGDPADARINCGDAVTIAARVKLGEIAPTDVFVEAYVVTERSANGTRPAERIPLEPGGNTGKDGYMAYAGTFVPPDSGRYQVTVRVTPDHPELVHPHELGLICWLSDAETVHRETGVAVGSSAGNDEGVLADAGTS